MNVAIKKLDLADFPPLLKEIPDPPKELWCQGKLPPKELKLLAVVGSRQYSSYGKQVIEKLIADLTGYPIGIVSGLALGIDAIAHENALKHGLYTLAVPGSGLAPEVIYPSRHRNLSEQIIASGGGLLSEFPPETRVARWTFPQRNRIMAGLCHATLLIEASARSGTLITARLTVDYNRELLAVPGNIFSVNSYGTHQFLKLGATLVSEVGDILEALHLETKVPTTHPLIPDNLSLKEKRVLELLKEPLDRDSLIRCLELPVSEASTILMSLEIKGYINYGAPHYIRLR